MPSHSVPIHSYDTLYIAALTRDGGITVNKLVLN